MTFFRDPTFFVPSLLITILFVLVLSPKSLFIFMILLGQGHFMLAYLYKHFAGRLERRDLVMLLGLILLVGCGCFAVVYFPFLFPYLIFLTLIIFIFHSTLDEMKIFEIGDRGLRQRILFSSVILYVPLLMAYLFNIGKGVTIPLLIISALLTVSMLSSKLKVIQGKVFFCVFLAISFFIPVILTLFPVISLYTLSGGIILYHYVRWYLYYFTKTNDKKTYVPIVLWVNISVFLLGIIHNLSPGVLHLYLLFDPVFFYGWTIVHIVATFSMREIV
jgi:hypothetical protein